MLFLHEWIFCDGFPLYTYRKKEFYSWTTTFAELPYEMRSSYSSPGIWVQSCYDADQLAAVGGYDTLLRAFRAGKEYLIRGIPMFVNHLNCLAMVFSVFHGIEGDAPARTELAGFKRAGGKVFRLCHECDADRDDYVHHLLNGLSFNERLNFKAQAVEIERLKRTSQNEWEEAAYRIGINRYSRKRHLCLLR